jgi:hypothetical protein
VGSTVLGVADAEEERPTVVTIKTIPPTRTAARTPLTTFSRVERFAIPVIQTGPPELRL